MRFVPCDLDQGVTNQAEIQYKRVSASTQARNQNRHNAWINKYTTGSNNMNPQKDTLHNDMHGGAYNPSDSANVCTFDCNKDFNKTSLKLVL